MVTMHGFFDLKPTISEPELKQAYDAFAEYLRAHQMIISYKAMRRSPNDNYDSSPPSTKYYITMDFHDLLQAEACWEFIEIGNPESAQLHRTLFSKIADYSFFLSEDLPN